MGERACLDVETTSQPSQVRHNAIVNFRQSPEAHPLAGYSTLVHFAPSSPKLEKAIPRRLDWTPPKPPPHTLVSPDSEGQASKLSRQMLHSFTYPGASAGNAMTKVTTKADSNGEPMKRRRIDLLNMPELHSKPIPSLSEADDSRGQAKDDGQGKKKMTGKKCLTITGLATSHYDDNFRGKPQATPMLQHFAKSQLAAGDDTPSSKDKEIGKVSKLKAPKRKPRVIQKVPVKPRLVSPSSAMKVVNAQETIFGSASQLARDESPTLLRETLEALKRSECFSSDPISPQQTQPLSIESMSPRNHRGTDRFVKRRNLWSAAGRDEDNALLHVDTVDLSDSPAVRLALAGKDVLLQPAGSNDGTRKATQPEGSNLLLAETPSIGKTSSLWDIDDIVTPGLPLLSKSLIKVHARTYHSSRSLEEPQKRTSPGGPTLDADVPNQSLPKMSEAVPVKPSYAGFTTNELQKQISAYGFKRIKKREAMIELLERCWDNKHGALSVDDNLQSAARTMTHGDFLSEVHAVSARPAPKVKKPRVKRKSDSTSTVAGEEPKKRKTAATKAKDCKVKDVKTPQKGASKTKSKDAVLDVDDIEPDSARVHRSPEKSVPVKAVRKKGKGASSSEKQKLATPPPMVPLSFSSSPALQGLHDQSGAALNKASSSSDQLQAADHVSTPGESLPSPDLHFQIHAAIHCSPEARSGARISDTRDHQKSPTWREKILLYDPIVLEELTVWLNTEGFKAIGEDREVNLVEVRSWCEQNGICCYGLAGGWRRRGRNGGDE